MTNQSKTEIVFVVDRSGSMSSIASDMRGGFDTLIADQKKVAGECHVTLTRFDNEYETVYSSKPLADVPPLELVPRGGTALLDALGRTIDATGARFSAMKPEDRPGKVLFVVITDGHENASREYNRGRVFEMVKAQQEKYSWDFVFLGANQDAIAAAGGIGIRAANVVNFDACAKGGEDLMKGLSNQIGSYRSARGDAGKSAALGDLQASYNAGGDASVLQSLKDKAAKADET